MTSAAWVVRAAGLAGLVASLVFLGATETPPRPYQFIQCAMRESIGVPCPFCGGTRAVRCAMRGQWEQAAYFNALAYPVLVLLAITAIRLSSELAAQAGWPCGWQIAEPLRVERWIQGRWFWVAVAVTLFWGWHLWLAWTVPKPELLNRRGALFFFIPFPVDPARRGME